VPGRYNRGRLSSEWLYFVPIPSFAEAGDLPQGVHYASLREVLEHFAQSTSRRKIVGMRLARVYELAASTGRMKRFIVFGSFVTAKPDPNDIDIFLMMHDTFDLTQVTGEARLIFDHAAAQAHFGASIFWLRQLAALPNEQESILNWQIKRDGARRGIVQITEA
jgi:predicted nucleotidyltransferase